MTLQAKIPDLPRPAFVAPCGSTLHPAASVAAVAGHKNREITSSVSPCALALVLCGAVTLLRSHSSACPCYHHSTLECLIVSHVLLHPVRSSLPCLSVLLLLRVLAVLSCLLLPPPPPLLSLFSCPSVLALTASVRSTACPLPLAPLVCPAMYVLLPMLLL